MSGKILEYEPMCGVVVSITIEEAEWQNKIDKNEELVSLAKEISQGSAKAVKE